ncbi:MAG: transcriptional repressor LexA [Anaerolineales bacterium]
MAKELSERQEKILEVIRDYLVEYGYPPTIREIGEAAAISSTSVVSYNLSALEKKGYLIRNKDTSRGLRLQEEITAMPVPLLGNIVAGEPIPVPGNEAPEAALDHIAVPTDMLNNTDDIYALRVRGNSMIDSLIADGDIVVMQHQRSAENGDTVAAWLVDEETVTLKEFHLEAGGQRVRLQPRNPAFEPIYVKADRVEIQGKVIGVIREM